MGKLSRAKGARWEREVARRFNETMNGADIRRGRAWALGIRAVAVGC